MQHLMTALYGPHVLLTSQGNVPIFIPRVGDVIVGGVIRERFRVVEVELTYTTHSVHATVHTERA